jgi:hypothetical protein
VGSDLLDASLQEALVSIGTEGNYNTVNRKAGARFEDFYIAHENMNTTPPHYEYVQKGVSGLILQKNFRTLSSSSN